MPQGCRNRGGVGGHKPLPQFLCPPQYYVPPRIFRSCDGPGKQKSYFSGCFLTNTWEFIRSYELEQLEFKLMIKSYNRESTKIDGYIIHIMLIFRHSMFGKLVCFVCIPMTNKRIVLLSALAFVCLWH